MSADDNSMSSSLNGQGRAPEPKEIAHDLSQAEATENSATVERSDTADAGFADNPGDAIEWQIISQPDDPFASELIFTERGNPVLWCQLDPLTLKSLIAGLSTVRDEQIAALTGTPVPAVQPHPETGETNTSATDAVQRSWWARHKILTALLIVIAAIFLTGFVLGGSNI